MITYTGLAITATLCTIAVDALSGVRVLRRPQYALFLGCVVAMKLVVNGVLTGTRLVQYNPSFYSGVRLGSIPLEDFLFGFSMVTVAVVCWEWCKRKGW